MSQPYYDEGLHTAEILRQGLTEASTGTMQFFLRVKILGASNGDGTYTPNRNQYERTVYLPLTEKTVEWVTPKLKLLGFTGTSMAQLDETHPQHQSFVGDPVELWCGHKPDNKGGVRENWSISEPMQVQTTVLEPKKLRQLDALFGAALKGGAKQAPPPAATTNYADGTEITDDDLPF